MLGRSSDWGKVKLNHHNMHSDTNSQDSKPNTDIPLEIILIILDYSLDSEPWHSRSAHSRHVLLVSRATYVYTLKLVYRTIAFSSLTSLNLFSSMLETQPTLMDLVRNLWVPSLHQLGCGNSNLRKVSAGRTISKLVTRIRYLECVFLHSESLGVLVPPSISSPTRVHTLHIHGPLNRRDIKNPISLVFRHVKNVFLHVPGAGGSRAFAEAAILLLEAFNSLVRVELVAGQNDVREIEDLLRAIMKKDKRINIQGKRPGLAEEQSLFVAWLNFE
jgi:hypothetical protein